MDLPMIETPGWTPECALPNVTLDEPIEASHAALVNGQDERLRQVAARHPGLETFLGAFRDEFGNQICPTIAMVREDAPNGVKTLTALGGFRDAVSVSAIVAGDSVRSPTGGIIHSDAFDLYPWFPNPRLEGYLGTITPAMVGIHYVKELRPQSAPALGRRSLSLGDMDHPLLEALLARWKHCFADEEYNGKDLRLFRSLEMARAASKVPGGVDANIYDAGRAVALWVSAFEILAHDEQWASLRQVLSLLNQVKWLRRDLRDPERVVFLDKRNKNQIQTNTAGEVYAHLNSVRNDFLHGNPVTDQTLRLEKCQKNVMWFGGLSR
jgi:hypothetical protein